MFGWTGVWGHCRRICLSNVSSSNVKSVSETCRLQTYCPDSFLAWCASQGMPRLSAHSWVLCKNGTRKYKNETVIPMIRVLCYIFTARWMPFVTQTVHCVLCWLQHIYQIVIYFKSNIRHWMKHWRRTNSSSSITLPKNTQCGNYCIRFVTYTVHTRYYVIYFQLTR